MFDANTAKQSATEPESDGFWTREQAEAHMLEFLSSLPPPPSLEELARAQGVKPVEKMEDLIPNWPEGEWDDEEDFDAIREQMRAGEIEIMRRKLAETPPTGRDPAEDYDTFERELWEQEVAAWDREHGETPHEDREA
jgi:hypothetical protein